jgi:hypothetical protein
MPFALFAALVSNPLAPRFVPFQFDIKGKDSRATIGDAVSIALEPIKNPVTGDPEGIRIERKPRSCSKVPRSCRPGSVVRR